ncbi:hypothetical protein BU16DRAFT_175385 [Lophium mytilinum]|uniref:Uncharacterized protein n=1 Tax=Lophium mytilinum TaxID=390894 RepID=A0A6A6QCI0_9PEZI|nr:hypothetical protein BU16DRAFT_175385 [Lophium mytilinum]
MAQTTSLREARRPQPSPHRLGANYREMPSQGRVWWRGKRARRVADCRRRQGRAALGLGLRLKSATRESLSRMRRDRGGALERLWRWGIRGRYTSTVGKVAGNRPTRNVLYYMLQQ